MIRSIDRDEVLDLLERDAQLVEVLPAHEYNDEHLPDAISIPLKRLDATSTAALDDHRPVIVYCWDSQCDMSPRAAVRLAALGFREIYDYVAGKADWLAAGLNTERAIDQPGRAGDAMRPVATCNVDATVSERGRIDPSAVSGVWIVVDDDDIVHGRLREARLAPNTSALIADVMELGPTTVRFHEPLDELRARMADRNIDHVLVTSPQGQLLGAVVANSAEGSTSSRLGVSRG